MVKIPVWRFGRQRLVNHGTTRVVCVRLLMPQVLEGNLGESIRFKKEESEQQPSVNVDLPRGGTVPALMFRSVFSSRMLTTVSVNHWS